MAERRIDMVDLLNALSWGEPESIERDKQRNNLKCEIRGTDIDGDALVVQVAISEIDFAVICITAY